MKDGPTIAPIAALIGDPARANILAALMDGRALTVSELAVAAGVALPTASGHLAKLAQARLVAAERQGRHRYFRLAGTEVADALEALMGLAEHTGARRARTGPRDAALREARVCYDHLAGEHAVAFMDAMLRDDLLSEQDGLTLTDAGRAALAAAGVAVTAKGRRPLCRACLDWSERRNHLAGALGAAVLRALIDRGWAKRGPGRLVRLSPEAIAFLRAGPLSSASWSASASR